MRGIAERHVLEIYVTGSCFGCDVARELATHLRALALPGIETRLVDLDAPGSVRPDAVFAVPTYLLDGEVVSLGNPDQASLIRQLEQGAITDEDADVAGPT